MQKENKMVKLVLLIIAIVFFVLKGLNVDAKGLDLMNFGFAFVTASFLV